MVFLVFFLVAKSNTIRDFVRRSVRQSVGHVFLKYHGNGDFKTIKHQETHRIAFLVAKYNSISGFVSPLVCPCVRQASRKMQIQVNSRKFRKIISFLHLLDASLFVSNLFLLLILLLKPRCYHRWLEVTR